MSYHKEQLIGMTLLLGIVVLLAGLIAVSPAEATFATFQYTGPPGGNDPQLGDEYGYLAGKVMTAQATLELLTGSAGGPWTASATSWSIAVGGTLFLASSTLPLTIYENIFMGTGPVLEQYRLRAGTESGGTFSEAFFTYWIDPNVNNFGYDMAQTWTPATAAGLHPSHVASGDQTVIFALTAPAPLPTTMLMLGSGLLGLLSWRRIRKG